MSKRNYKPDKPIVIVSAQSFHRNISMTVEIDTHSSCALLHAVVYFVWLTLHMRRALFNLDGLRLGKGGRAKGREEEEEETSYPLLTAYVVNM